jgi:4-amino-4-deoxy-L-arabinose transferase-like glycosyltransferase
MTSRVETPQSRGWSADPLWWGLVLILFCLPLFIGLGRGDLFGDEGIYSFGVDRMLEAGDWLAPKVSPFEDRPFLEKPPLKFWIVAAPIKLGLLPHNEFGLRFWDALFGSISFLYVFAIGCRLAGPISGVVAVLILFAQSSLIFDHGLRSNNMEASLVLCYCGGIFHFLAWATAGSRPRARAHAAAVGLYFALGFMTKFVAAIFLPLILLTAGIVVAEYRRKLLRDWRLWSAVSALVVALCAPWFVYAHQRFGPDLWNTMFAAHIVERFTASLDPAHIHPWNYYLATVYRGVYGSDAGPLVAIGLAGFVVQFLRRRASPEAMLMLLWLALPLVAISFGTSKLYHYAYPYLPPLALAGGCAVPMLLAVLPAPAERVIRRLGGEASPMRPKDGVRWHPAVQAVLMTVAIVAALLAIASLIYGPLRLGLAGGVVFKSRGVLRPMLVAITCGVLAAPRRAEARVIVPLLVGSLLPLPTYRENLVQLTNWTRPMSAVSNCLGQMQRTSAGSLVPGLYVDLPDGAVDHPLNYYFRRLRPWTRPETPSPARIGDYLEGPNLRPVLVSRSSYDAFRRLPATGAVSEAAQSSTPALALRDNVLLLLPGPYAACGGPLTPSGR